MLRLIAFAAAVTSLSMPPAGARQAQPETPRDPAPLEVAPPPHERPAHQPQGEGGEFRNADELLTALEAADTGLSTLTADVIYDRTEVFDSDRQVRTGRLWFHNQPQEGRPPLRRFAVEFDTLYLGDRREDDVRQYIFDGVWMAEKIPGEKICNRQQVVAPGEQFDPLRIGEGPLPVPIGQKKADILARFDVELVPAGSGLAPDRLEDLSEAERRDLDNLVRFATAPGTYQIRLTPRPEAAQRSDFAEVRLWYRRDGQGRLLPHMARTVKAVEAGEGDVSILQLSRIRTNEQAEVNPAIFDTRRPQGWDGRDEPWREAQRRDEPGR